MVPLKYLSSRKNVQLLCLVLSFLGYFLLCHSTQAQSLGQDFKSTKKLLLSDAEDFEALLIVSKQNPTSSSTKTQVKSVKSPLSSAKNQTKLIKSAPGSGKKQTKLTKSTSSLLTNQTKSIKSVSSSPKNQTKFLKTVSNSSKNQTKLTKLTLESAKVAKNSSKLIKPSKDSQTPIKPLLQKTNSTKTSSNSVKKPSDLTKLSPPKTKQTKMEPNPKNSEKSQPKKQTKPTWLDEEDEDLVAEFRDLPSRFQQTLLPDLEKISSTSKVYLTRYNKQIATGFKPYVGTKYAPMIASFVSFAFIIIPLILVSLLFNRIKSYFSLQKILIFIQVYLCIYFYILCLSSLVTGLEPLRFFYAASRSTYICVQVLQTLGYVLYLLMLLMYLVLVFSSETVLGLKVSSLAQNFVGFAVGLHYYVTVFHRVVLKQPPKTNWKVHGIYATCFLVIGLLATADQRKKAYLEESGEEGKKN